MLVDETGYQFTREELRALLMYTGKDTTKPAYMCFVLDPAKGRAFATDGARIAVVRAPGQTASFAALALTRASLSTALQVTPPKGRMRIDPMGKAMIVSSKGVDLTAYTFELYKHQRDGVFPMPIDNVFPFGTMPEPVRDPCRTVALDADYLADLHYIVRAIGEEGTIVTTVHRGPSPLDPVAFTMNHWQVLQMPVRL